MNVRGLAKLFGWVFVILGILGFVPGITNGGELLGIFQVDTALSVVHLITGILALLVAGSRSSSRSYFRLFGVLYAIVAIWGFSSGNVWLIGEVDTAGNVLNTVVAIIALWAGFGGE
jgi:hypothetical protein